MRGGLVKRLGELLTEHKDDLADLVTLEVGKIRSEALGEVQEMIDICDFAVGLSRQLDGRTMPSERPGHRLMETWHPLGVVGVISAFNFPVAVWSWNTALALVCGDTVVWKPSEQTPLRRWPADALLAGLPPSRRARRASTARARRRAGGRATGRQSARAAGQRDRFGADGGGVGAAGGRALRPALLELGGNNAAVVTPSADLDLAVRGIVFAAAGTAGQRCTTLRRLIVHESIADQLLDTVVAAYRQLPVGNPFDDGHAGRAADQRPRLPAMQSALDTSRRRRWRRGRGRRAGSRTRRRRLLRRARRWSACRHRARW